MRIAGYTYRADTYCPPCVIVQLPTGPGGEFDGWALAHSADYPAMDVEQNLDEIAFAFGIDRMDEWSFDSGDFPKVIFSTDTTEDDICGGCGRPL